MIKVKKIKPLYTMVITTMDTYEKDNVYNGIVYNAKGDTKEYQKVIAVGDTVRCVKEGDYVHINPSRYATYDQDVNSMKPRAVKGFNIPTIIIGGKKYFKLQEADIDFVAEDWEEVEDKINVVITPAQDIVK